MNVIMEITGPTSKLRLFGGPRIRHIYRSHTYLDRTKIHCELIKAFMEEQKWQIKNRIAHSC
jgi:hypothetical protein